MIGPGNFLVQIDSHDQKSIRLNAGRGIAGVNLFFYFILGFSPLSLLSKLVVTLLEVFPFSPAP